MAGRNEPPRLKVESKVCVCVCVWRMGARSSSSSCILSKLPVSCQGRRSAVTCRIAWGQGMKVSGFLIDTHLALRSLPSLWPSQTLCLRLLSLFGKQGPMCLAGISPWGHFSVQILCQGSHHCPCMLYLPKMTAYASWIFSVLQVTSFYSFTVLSVGLGGSQEMHVSWLSSCFLRLQVST